MSDKRRFLVLAAHPDDADIKFGGTAIKLVRAGHEVIFVSLCNGDCGHFDTGLDPRDLADRRYAETQAARRVSGIKEYRVWKGSHDCELMPSLENRKRVVALIREYQPDVVLSHRPCDYHADHRATAQLAQDAAYLTGVPMFMRGLPTTTASPVFAYLYDPFTDPRPIRADAVVPFDDVLEEKCRILDCHVSQFYEWLAWEKGLREFDHTRMSWEAKCRYLQEGWGARFIAAADHARERLHAVYGDRGANVRCAEIFEISPYGRKVSPDEFQAMFV